MSLGDHAHVPAQGSHALVGALRESEPLEIAAVRSGRPPIIQLLEEQLPDARSLMLPHRSRSRTSLPPLCFTLAVDVFRFFFFDFLCTAD